MGLDWIGFTLSFARDRKWDAGTALRGETGLKKTFPMDVMENREFVRSGWKDRVSGLCRHEKRDVPMAVG